MQSAVLLSYVSSPRAPSYLTSRLMGYVTRGYIEPRTHYVGNWSPREGFKVYGSRFSLVARSLNTMFIAGSTDDFVDCLLPSYTTYLVLGL